MKRDSYLSLPRVGVLFTWSLLTLPLAHAAASEPLSVAVFDFRGVHPAQAREATDLIISGLSADPRVVVFDRGQLNKVLAEQALDLSREMDPGTAVQVGRLTGAAVVVTGRILRDGDGGRYPVVARITSTKTGRVVTATVEGQRDGKNPRLPAAVGELNKKILATLSADSASFGAAPTKSREDRIADITRLTRGSKRPVVSFRFNATAGNSASTVETELGLIFQRAGFVVVDEKSAEKPNLEVTGDITAELGSKLGTLFPARATINLKVRERGTGKIVTLDRETADVTDIGEQSALHTALENAADALAVRLVPLLSQ